jgi:hypothetical protein
LRKPFPISASPSFLADAVEHYGRTGEPLSVNFRELAPFKSGADRATHLMHPYPAKLLLNIPYLFFQCRDLAPASGRVLDPFCGSGRMHCAGDGHNFFSADRLVHGDDESPR